MIENYFFLKIVFIRRSPQDKPILIKTEKKILRAIPFISIIISHCGKGFMRQLGHIMFQFFFSLFLFKI